MSTEAVLPARAIPMLEVVVWGAMIVDLMDELLSHESEYRPYPKITRKLAGVARGYRRCAERMSRKKTLRRKLYSRHTGATIHGWASLLTQCWDELAVADGQLPGSDAMRHAREGDKHECSTDDRKLSDEIKGPKVSNFKGHDD